MNPGNGDYYGSEADFGAGPSAHTLPDGAYSMNTSVMMPQGMAAPFNCQGSDPAARSDVFRNPGTSGTSPFGWADDSGEAALLANTGTRPKGKKQRKVKMYNWTEQDDPELERRRKMAIKEKKKRDKEEEEQVQKRVALRKTQEEVENLRREKSLRSSNISIMEQILAMQAQANPDANFSGNFSGNSGYQ